jgi:hypothetical protein
MKLDCSRGFDIDIMRQTNPRFRFRARRNHVEITPKCACPDCGEPMADGGACGYYCTAKGCDHDTIKGAKK